MIEQTKLPTLTEIFSEILANLAFMFTDDDDADLDPADTWIETSISYVGPQGGLLRFTCTRAFTGQLAANLLGVDPEDEEAEVKSEDAVKEFMNILCGQWVTASLGTQDVYNLTIPQCKEVSPPDPAAAADPHTTALSVNATRVWLTHVPGVCA